MPIPGRGLTGVYCFIHIPSGKRYVGSTTASMKERKRKHIGALNRGKHHSSHFQHAWDKYGERCFVFKVLEWCLPELCIEREQYWIDHYNSADCKFGYNRNPRAESCLGVKRSDEYKAKLSKSKKLQKLSPAHIEALRKSHLGKKLSSEHLAAFHSPSSRAKAAAKLKGIKRTDEQRAKLSEVCMGKRGTRTGMTNTPDHNARISATLNTPEVKARMREAASQHRHTEESKAKMSKARKGIPVHTEESKAKMSKAKKGKPWSEARRIAQQQRRRYEC